MAMTLTPYGAAADDYGFSLNKERIEQKKTATLGIDRTIGIDEELPSIFGEIDALGGLANLDLSPTTKSILADAITPTDASKSPFAPLVKAQDKQNAMMADYLADVKDKANKARNMGMMMKNISSAGEIFNAALNLGYHKVYDMQRDNTVQSAENQITALDNQVLYKKNQMMDRFNQVVANTAVATANKNLKVSTGSILEQNKELAHDINEDYRMLESNAELDKINLRATQKLANVTNKLQHNMLWTNLVGSVAKAGTSYLANQYVYGDSNVDMNKKVYGG